ncbi:hypothetical protein [Cedecea sp. P7760]|uniref:hypothetical protein n=1 Tax=Cedecea sp. P7760 TaxID=2726983 RepID=UPI0015A1360B|nr:hypothetical protein [Cedecea sp. P7760]NWC63695.1 hypothetical protein [Cedecea sp. P7760]
MTNKFYAERDLMALDEAGGHYCRHVSAMTGEGLHSKSDIAAELGWRDMQIAELQRQLTAYEATVTNLTAQVQGLAAENADLRSGESAAGFFSYGSEHGFEWHKSAKEAIESAEGAIDDYRGDACDGWDEETSSVCWGIIMQSSTKVDERPLTGDDSCDPAIETVCDYALLPNIETRATDAALAEIRAQGVDALSKFAGQEYQRHTGDKAMQRKWKGVVLLCTGFASELRNGASDEQ